MQSKPLPGYKANTAEIYAHNAGVDIKNRTKALNKKLRKELAQSVQQEVRALPTKKD